MVEAHGRTQANITPEPWPEQGWGACEPRLAKTASRQ